MTIDVEAILGDVDAGKAIECDMMRGPWLVMRGRECAPINGSGFIKGQGEKGQGEILNR